MRFTQPVLNLRTLLPAPGPRWWCPFRYLVALPPLLPTPSQLRGANAAVGTGGGRTTAGGAALTFTQSMGRGRPRGAGAVPEPPPASGVAIKQGARGSGCSCTYRARPWRLHCPHRRYYCCCCCSWAPPRSQRPPGELGWGTPLHHGHAHRSTWSYSDPPRPAPTQDPETLRRDVHQRAQPPAGQRQAAAPAAGSGGEAQVSRLGRTLQTCWYGTGLAWSPISNLPLPNTTTNSNLHWGGGQ